MAEIADAGDGGGTVWHAPIRGRAVFACSSRGERRAERVAWQILADMALDGFVRALDGFEAVPRSCGRPARRHALCGRVHHPDPPAGNGRSNPVHHWRETYGHTRRPPGSATSRELSAIARLMPSDAITQILRAADRTSHECFEVIAAVASVIAEDVRTPKDVARNERGHGATSRTTGIPARLAAFGFPGASVPIAGLSRRGSSLPSHSQQASTRRAM
jgi:hypothetical protein